MVGQSSEPVYVLSADVAEEAAHPSTTVPDPAMLVVSSQVTQGSPAQLAIDLRWAGGDPSSHFYMGVNLNGFAASDGQWFPATWWGMRMNDSPVYIELDLQNRALSATTSNGPIQVSSELLDSRDGDYTATMSLWEPELVARGWATPFIELFETQSRNGQVVQVVPRSTDLTVVRLLPQAVGR